LAEHPGRRSQRDRMAAVTQHRTQRQVRVEIAECADGRKNKTHFRQPTLVKAEKSLALNPSNLLIYLVRMKGLEPSLLLQN
jgi:hypothetical protein